MAKGVIDYDKDLPEIPGRLPWEKPTSFLMKDAAAPTGWREDTSGRRPSRLLLVSKIRSAVDTWRTGDPSNGIEPYALPAVRTYPKPLYAAVRADEVWKAQNADSNCVTGHFDPLVTTDWYCGSPDCPCKRESYEQRFKRSAQG